MGPMARRMTLLGTMLAVAAFVLLPLAAARADPNQKDADAAWKTASECSHAAFKKYPDYTPEGNAKREQARLECLRNHKLPAPAPSPQAATGEPQ
jgi:hypothetical protein